MNRKIVCWGLGALLGLAACGTEERSAASARDDLTIVGEDPTDVPLDGIDDAQLARFVAGDAGFEAVFRESQGLGPLFIRPSCASCHGDDSKGPGAVTKVVQVEEDGVTPRAEQDALPFGPTERPQLTAGATTPIHTPEPGAGFLVSRRIGPAVFGRGYLEAIDAAELERVEAEQLAAGGLVSGRIHRVRYQSEANPDQPFHSHVPGQTGLVGRFGLKARIATIDEFCADAYQGDMGITTPMRPSEPANPDGLTDDARPGVDLGLDTVNEVADYVRLLALPARTVPAEADAQLFEDVGCATCHVPSLRTRADYPIPQLAGIDAPVYSDLLLHDLGVGLADGVVDGDAGPREWRTAPLIGLRHFTAFLHDGRAATLDEAILAHRSEGSESNDVVDAWEALEEPDRARLEAFLLGL